MGAVLRKRRMCEELGGKRNGSFFWCGIPGKCTLVLSSDSPRRFGASFVRYTTVGESILGLPVASLCQLLPLSLAPALRTTICTCWSCWSITRSLYSHETPGQPITIVEIEPVKKDLPGDRNSRCTKTSCRNQGIFSRPLISESNLP